MSVVEATDGGIIACAINTDKSCDTHDYYDHDQDMVCKKVCAGFMLWARGVETHHLWPQHVSLQCLFPIIIPGSHQAGMIHMNCFTDRLANTLNMNSVCCHIGVIMYWSSSCLKQLSEEIMKIEYIMINP